MLVQLALAVARSMSESTLRRWVRRVFVRTTRQLDAACADPNAAQHARLRQLLAQNAHTEFGRVHGFSAIKTFDDYRRAVPIRGWDGFDAQVQRMVNGERNVLVTEDPYFFATTSGTTGHRKLIAMTSQFIAECRVTNKVLFRSTLLALPELLQGKRLSMRSPMVESLPHGKKAGSITVALAGFEDDEGAIDAVPSDVFMLEDFQTRYALALRFALQERVTVCAAVNPSTLLLFATTLAQHGPALAAALRAGVLGFEVAGDRGQRLRRRARIDVDAALRIEASIATHGHARMADALPHLAGLVCWKGGSAPWYLSKLTHSYGALPILDYGYCASEGMFAAPLSTTGADSLIIPHAHVVELAPYDQLDAVRAGQVPTTLLADAKVGALYVPIITTGAGLYRYDMNDVIEVTGKHQHAPIVTFRHKAGAMASVTGEKVGESHIVNAAARAGVVAQGFCAGPLLPPGDAAPFWLLALDSADTVDTVAIAAAFDRALRLENLEYDAKRASQRLDPARACLLPAGAVARLRAARVAAGAPDAHVKIPHLSPDGALLLQLGLAVTAAHFADRLPVRVMAANGTT